VDWLPEEIPESLPLNRLEQDAASPDDHGLSDAEIKSCFTTNGNGCCAV
jgi:hypothetical protein